MFVPRSRLLVVSLAAALGACSDDTECGVGTYESDGVCQPTPSTMLECGAGTSEQNGVCIANVECGAGTAAVGGRCVPDTPLSCGAGTSEMNGECVPANPLTCGPDTVAEGGQCVPTNTSPSCAEGTVLVDGSCRPADVVWTSLPFPAGFSAPVTQAFNGFLSHYGDDLHAVDFGVPEGTTVVAARAGLVVAVREDSSTGCADVSCEDQANYVLVDHGDGTISRYFHLQLNSVAVDVGDVVCAGQTLAASGNTGYSTGPHLHLDVTNLWRYTLPLRFNELATTSAGVAIINDLVTSANALSTCEGAGRASICPPETFRALGVEVDPGLPCTVARYGMAYPLSGRIVGPGAGLLLAQWSSTQDWIYGCIPLDAQKHFATSVLWSATTFPDYGYVSLIATEDPACTIYPGWHSSPLITFVE